MICADCLEKYGGEEQRCPGTCEYVGHCDLQSDRERDTQGFGKEPRHVIGSGGNYYSAEAVEQFPGTYGKRYG